MRRGWYSFACGALVGAVVLPVGCGDDGDAEDADAAVSPAGDAAPADASLPDAAPTDAAIDGGTSVWTWCPSADDYVGDPGWPNAVDAIDTAVYCATFNEARTLKQELALKGKLRVVTGTYPLPADNSAHDFWLPTCLDLGDGAPPVPTGTGTIDHSASSFMGTTYHRNSGRQDFTHAAATRGLLLQLNPVGPDGTDVTMVLDGSRNAVFGEASGWGFQLCDASDECYSLDALQFDSCTHEASELQRHTLTLVEGSIILDIRIGVSAASTEPGAFVRGRGDLNGTNFDQQDYWKLVYNPEHHHFSRDFAVFFDVPIDGACGLEIINLEPWDDFTPDQVFTIDCELNRIDELTVTDAQWERFDP